jgi:hypothetical protein
MIKMYKVRFYYKNFYYIDEIRGISEEDALKNARWKWSEAENIKLLRSY